jgi:xylitol oxidase
MQPDSWNGFQKEVSHFAPRTNWAGNVAFAASRLHQPKSIDALRRIIQGSRQIRALGSGHSFSRIADTAGDLVLLDGLPKAFYIDRAHSTVTVAAGMTYTEVVVELHRAGFALANMASIPQISIGGACTTGTHGSGDGQRVLAASVAAMQLVVAEGDLAELRRDLHRDTFPGAVVALGALGIVTQLTLEIEPAFEMSQQVHLGVPLQLLEDRLDDVFSAGFSVSAFTDWASDEAKVLVKRRMDQAASTWTAGRPAQHTIHPVPGMSPESCTEQLGVVGPWHERLPHFRPKPSPEPGNELQSEVFLPRIAAKQAITALREISHLIAPALLVSEVRTVCGDDLWLSPAYGRDTIAIHFTWIADESSVLPAIAAVEERLMPLDPRPHWAKLTTMKPRQILPGYERAPDFERLMVEYDPKIKFRNDFLESFFPTH